MCMRFVACAHMCTSNCLWATLSPSLGENVPRRERLNTCDPNSRSLSSLAARSIPLLCEATLAQALRESELGLPVMIRAQPCHRQQEDDLNVCRDWKLSYHWTYNSFIIHKVLFEGAYLRFTVIICNFYHFFLSTLSTALLQGMAQVPHCLLASSCWRRMTFGTSEPRQSPDRARIRPEWSRKGRVDLIFVDLVYVCRSFWDRIFVAAFWHI